MKDIDCIKETKIGWISYCPQCKKETQTTRCACGCGNCTVCDYRWCCYGDAPVIKKDEEKKSDEYVINVTEPWDKDLVVHVPTVWIYPICDHNYEVDDKFTGNGTTYKCSKCGHIVIQFISTTWSINYA